MIASDTELVVNWDANLSTRHAGSSLKVFILQEKETQQDRDRFLGNESGEIILCSI